jgi:hypothetical protein
VIPSQDEREGRPSASSAPQWIPCPGSHAERQKRGPTPPSDASEKGTEWHAEIEKAEDFSTEERTIKRTIEIREHMVALTLGVSLEKEFLEHRVWLPNKVASAKPDYIAMNGSGVLVINYKSGYGEIARAEQNHQVSVEMVCAAELFFSIYNRWPTVTTGALIHPRLPRERQVSFRALGKQAIQTLRQQVINAAIAAMDENAYRVAGPQCHWCPGNKTCATGLTYALVQAAVTTGGKAMTEVLEQLPAKRKLLDGIEERARELIAADPDAVPGWKLTGKLTMEHIVWNLRQKHLITEKAAKALVREWFGDLLETEEVVQKRGTIVDDAKAANILIANGFTEADVRYCGKMTHAGVGTTTNQEA